MLINRIFLDWNLPCLQQATQWLCNQFCTNPSELGRPDPGALPSPGAYSSSNTCDLSHLLIVLPGSRAARRLLELLVIHAQKNGNLLLLPPRIITVGELPESLYSPTFPMVSPLHGTILRAQTLAAANQSQPELLTALMPTPPKQGDFTAWLSLAQELDALNATLAADALQINQVAPRAADALDFSFNDEVRWQALSELQQLYENRLGELGLTDRHTARFLALSSRACRCESHIILLATADLNFISRNMLASMNPALVTALIHAPESEENHFDSFGCLNVDHWSRQQIPLDSNAMHFVNKPTDQACQAIQLLTKPLGNSTISLSQKFTLNQITLGLGDETTAPMIQRSLQLSGIPTHSGIGQSANRSRPALLLAALATLLEQKRLCDLSDLLRHPDFETHLLAAIPQNSANTTTQTRQAIGNWISLTDDYITRHLRGQPLGQWLGDESRIAPLKQIHDHVMSLLPPNRDADKPAPLSHWATIISQILTRIYASHHLQQHIPEHKILAQSLGFIGDILRQFSAIAPEQSPQISLAQALRVTLSQLATQTLSPLPTPQSLELLGWLELQLDDAPALIITGFNEGLIPQSKSADPFLPDGLRKCLGLTDNHRRLARDAYSLTAILHSRPHVQLIAARRGTDNEPLTPSRLLLHCSSEELTHRVLEFFEEPKPRDTIDTLLPWQPSNALLMPFPASNTPAITSLRVTDFKDYIACPYRFYLSTVLQLEGSDDSAVELDQLQFGTLTHQVLEDFARSDLAQSSDVEKIEAFFTGKTRDLVRHQFGTKPPAAVVIQSAQLQYRLTSFALWQACETAKGWRILPPLAERDVRSDVIVDGQPFTIIGRIDRIDHHPQQGYRLMDYKTGDTAKTPDKVHRLQGQWVDLQLPLYKVLAKSISMIDPALPLSPGYMLLPKDTKAVKFEPATWEPAQWDEAIEKAHWVIRQIRRGIFWPPAQPPDFPDDFAFLCGDELSERAAIIKISRQSQPAKNPENRP